MIQLLFVGDGKRDAVTVPHLVATILGCEILAQTRDWFGLRVRGRGYDRKLRYALAVARDIQAPGVVATLDADKAKRGKRLGALKKGREEQRERMDSLRVALGEAVPHGEAWLLDDPVAVRQGLSLPKDASVPNVRRTKSPKEALRKLLKSSPRSDRPPLEVLPDIALDVRLSQCLHAKKTGFQAFVDDVKSELAPLIEEDAKRS